MTTIPYETHMKIRQVVAEYMAPLQEAYRKLSVGHRLKGHVSKRHEAVETSPVVWYFKGTKLDLAFSRETGYILLDHVRRNRSSSFHNLDAAMKARVTMLKEIEAYEDARRQEADALAKSLEVQEAQV